MKTTKPEESSQTLIVHEPRDKAVAKYDPALSNVDIGALFAEAVKQGSAMEVIKELRQMEADMQARKAKAAFDEAMEAFQTECPVLVKDAKGGVAKYAKLESIAIQIRPLLQRYGLRYSFHQTENKDNKITVICRVTHKAGHHEDCPIELRLPDKTRAMNDSQQDAACITYGQRYALAGAFGLVIAGEDIDGATGKLKGSVTTVKPQAQPTPDDAANKRKLADLLRSVHGWASGYNLDQPARDKMTQWLIDEAIISDTQTVSDLAGQELASAVAKVQSKLNQPPT